MTDYDVSWRTSVELTELREIIFGGPRPPSAMAAKILSQLRLSIPFMVVCVQSDERVEPELSATYGKQVRCLRLHAGLEYWFCQQDANPLMSVFSRRHLVHGVAQRCLGLDDLQRTVQHSITTARRIEQSELLKIPPDITQEPRLRSTLLSRISARDPAYVAMLDLWMTMIMVRYMHGLNTLRRKMMEFLTSLTRANDEKDLAHPFYLVIMRLYDCHTYSGLRKLMPELVALLLQYLDKAQTGAGDFSRAQSPAVKAAVQWVREQFREPISLEDVAIKVGVSAPHLARSWRQEIGNSIGAALRELRLSEAKRLLSEGDRTILDVALRCGFGSVEHFHRTFRTCYKCSPDVWRKSVHDMGGSA